MTLTKNKIKPEYFRIAILLALCIILSICSKDFLKISNLMNVLRQAAILMVLGCGMTLVIITRGIDLSVAGIMSFSACLCATLMNNSYPVFPAIVLTLLFGALFGFLNGVLTGVVGLPAFVATYGVKFIADGLALILMDGNILYGFPNSYLFLGVGFIVKVIPIMVINTLLIAFMFHILLSQTKFGKQVYCVGANAKASYYSGIKSKLILILVFMLCGVCASIAGIFQSARMNAAQAGIGDQYQMLAVAAVIMGGTSMSGGEGGIGGTLIGAIILTLIVNGMNLLDIPANAQSLITGIVIVASVVLDVQERNKQNKVKTLKRK